MTLMSISLMFLYGTITFVHASKCVYYSGETLLERLELITGEDMYVYILCLTRKKYVEHSGVYK
jgi:hypothetical protein